MTGKTHARFSVSLALGLVVAAAVGAGVHHVRRTAPAGGLLSEPAAPAPAARPGGAGGTGVGQTGTAALQPS